MDWYAVKINKFVDLSGSNVNNLLNLDILSDLFFYFDLTNASDTMSLLYAMFCLTSTLKQKKTLENGHEMRVLLISLQKVFKWACVFLFIRYRESESNV